MDIEELNRSHLELENVIVSKRKAVDLLEKAMDQLVECKAKIRVYLAENFDNAQKNTKKTAGIEILELYIVNKFPSLNDDYQAYIKYQAKVDILKQIISSYESDMIAIQSMMKQRRELTLGE